MNATKNRWTTDQLRKYLEQCRKHGMNAQLAGADFEGLNLTEFNLRGADLRGANFSGADLDGADLRDTKRDGADFTGAHLTDVKW